MLANRSWTGFRQVRWCLRQADDFFGSKTCLGQDSAITTCRDIARRFVTSSLCFDVLARWTLKNDRRTNLFDTFYTVIYLFSVMTLCESRQLRHFLRAARYKLFSVVILVYYVIMEQNSIDIIVKNEN